MSPGSELVRSNQARCVRLYCGAERFETSDLGEELMAQLREQGIEDCAQVKRACMEADGMISVIKMKA